MRLRREPISLQTETAELVLSHVAEAYGVFLMARRFGINHPASGGWSYRAWTPWVRAVVARAIHSHRAGGK